MLRGTTSRWRRGAVLAAALVALTALLATMLSPAAADDTADEDGALYLVTLTGPGTAGHRSDRPRSEVAQQMLDQQDRLLDAVDAPEPIYRWTTALNGVAVRLTPPQARTLAGAPRVALVEPNTRHRLASPRPATAAPGLPASVPGGALDARGGSGTVIGFVDSGIDPHSRAFSDVAPLGGSPRFGGSCDDAPAEPAWDAGDCGRKIVGAEWFVAGFGADAVRSGESLSPLDTTGHGTQMASIAAGTAEVPVRVAGHRLGRSSGVAPRSRIAAYKACWSAPNPTDDGCATADLVAAVDQATADRVDVLNLSVTGNERIDTVQRALLGAAEADVVVVGAAGNGGDQSYAGHPSPWVVTVGATTGDNRVGDVVAGGLRWQGAMASRNSVPRARLVYGSEAAAPGARRRDARLCAPGSLDAGRVAGAVVVCRRGETARVGKSLAVRRADGVGMILVNRGRGSTDADLHAVPTVHLRHGAARELRRWARDRDRPQVRLRARGVESSPTRVAPFSPSSDPTLPLIKPDVVAPATEVVAAVPGGWTLATGTSAAAAHVSGVAAALSARPRATAELVRSALLGSARPVGASHGGRAGAGKVDHRLTLPQLSYLVSPRQYRSWLTGNRRTLNRPTALLVDGKSRVRRRITNTSSATVEVTAHTSGFEYPVRVYPSYAELAPGDTLSFTVTVDHRGGPEDGVVVWRVADGKPTRLTVATAR